MMRDEHSENERGTVSNRRDWLWPIRFGIVLILLFAGTVCRAGLIDTLYEKVRRAQDTGSYLELLKLLSQKGTKQDIQRELGELLEKIKRLPREKRKAVLREIFFYFSKSNGTYKQTPLSLDKAVTVSQSDLEAGNFSTKGVAKELLLRVSEYEKAVSIPIYEQVRKELAAKFPSQHIFFIGRDFTAAQMWAAQRAPEDAARFHTANTSRAVKDAIHEGETVQMRELLSQVGLNTESMVKEGIVFVDSSMAGKIPMAILKAVTEMLDGKKAFQLLSRAHIVYLKSSQKEGMPVSEAAQQQANKGSLSKEALADLLEHREGIPEFSLKLPKGYSHYTTDKHHLAEHRPKFLVSTTGFSEETYGVGLKSEKPEGLGVVARSLMGLHADLVLLEESEKIGPVKSPSKTKKGASGTHQRNTETVRLESQLQEHLTELARNGNEALTSWQDAHDRQAEEEFHRIKVVNTKDKKFPFELVVGGKRIMRLVKKLGEGNNIVAYLTEKGTALKLVKEPSRARKNLLGVWMQSVLDDYDLPYAKVLSMSPAGTYVEQEYAPLGDLETLFGHSEKSLPKGIHEQVVDLWEKAYELAKKEGIWLDFKAANFSLGFDKKIVLLDYVPRLNSTKTRFFRESTGKKLSSEEMVDLFLHYRIQKGKAQNTSPQDPELGHKIVRRLRLGTTSQKECLKLIKMLGK